jgi:hypothetical protein
MAKLIKYPFTPKSTAYLIPGQFWTIPLSNGKYACGRVIQVTDEEGYELYPKAFLAGLMDWIGDTPPTAESIAHRKVLQQYCINIKCITKIGSQILGIRELSLDTIEPEYFVYPALFTPGVSELRKGLFELREAVKSDYKKYQSFTVSGYMIINMDAESHFVQGKKIHKDMGSLSIEEL